MDGSRQGAASEAVARWLTHITALAGGIGARPPGRPAEARARDYCRRALETAGYRPVEETFATSGSVFLPHLPAALGFLAAFVIYPLALPGSGHLAAGIVWFALYCEVMELTLRSNPFHVLLPRRSSGNVYAVAEPARAVGSAGGAGPGRDIVVIGHLDTQRTPIIFSSPRWMAVYRLYSTLAFAAFALQAVLYLFGPFFRWTWVWPVTASSAVAAVLLIFLCLQAESTPFTAGANDNATAAALVLTLAEDLARAPLEHCRVWLVCTGSEEALHEGAKTFFFRRAGELRRPAAVALEMLGCAGPAWVVREGFVLPLHSTPELRRTAERVAAAHPELGAYPGVLSGGVTEMSDAILAGVPAITIMGLTPEGRGPFWHLPTDTVEQMDPAALERNYRFTRAFLAELDREEGHRD